MVRWQGGKQSRNVEDRRGAGGAAKAGLGLGGLALVVVFVLLGGDPQLLVGALEESASAPSTSGGATSPEDDERAAFVSVILADTETVWGGLFADAGQTYREPKLVLFRDSVRSACGNASAAMGPFYCSGDERAYIDLSFFDELARRFGAPGDFAQAYVLAHEIGHHVQHLLGTSDKIHRAQQGVSEAEANALSVRLELQADCYAGVWAHHAHAQRQLLEEGDIEEGLRAASAIGDDTLQRQAQGYAVPDAFTHGSSAQRVEAFKTGVAKGLVAECRL